MVVRGSLWHIMDAEDAPPPSFITQSHTAPVCLCDTAETEVRTHFDSLFIMSAWFCLLFLCFSLIYLRPNSSPLSFLLVLLVSFSFSFMCHTGCPVHLENQIRLATKLLLTAYLTKY